MLLLVFISICVIRSPAALSLVSSHSTSHVQLYQSFYSFHTKSFQLDPQCLSLCLSYAHLTAFHLGWLLVILISALLSFPQRALPYFNYLPSIYYFLLFSIGLWGIREGFVQEVKFRQSFKGCVKFQQLEVKGEVEDGGILGRRRYKEAKICRNGKYSTLEHQVHVEKWQSFLTLSFQGKYKIAQCYLQCLY